ncbi:MAG: STAS domain-containing protein [Bacteroidota bacterium]
MSNFGVAFRERPVTAGPAPVRVLDLSGELDAHTAPDFEAAIEDCLNNQQHYIVVNGAGLDYISSAGLGVFMAFIEQVREQGGDIKIAALQPRVFNVFDLLGFPVLFDILKTEDEAVSKFTN